MLDTRPRTYNPTDPVESAHLNRLFDEDIALWKALVGSALLVVDDFTGAALNTGLWTAIGAPSVASDPGAGGMGVAFLTCSAAPDQQGFQSCSWRAGARAWRGFWIAAYDSTSADAGSTSECGIRSVNPAEEVYFQAAPGTTNYQLVYWGGTVDTGISKAAVAGVPQYHKFQLDFDGTTIRASVDGTVCLTTSTVPVWNAPVLTLVQNRTNVDPTTPCTRVDKAALWVGR